MTRRSKFILIFILTLGFLLRVYKVNIPLADHHSWRQADTAAVSRNFIKEGWNFLKPRIDNMIPLHPGKPNNERLFLVEPPIYNTIVALFYKFFGVKEKIARFVSIFFSLGSTVFLYLISSYFLGERQGLLSAFFFAVLPYNIYYSRVILPEPMIIFLNLGMIYFCLKWLDTESNLNFLFFLFYSMLSFSQKSFPLFLLFPIFYLIFKKYRFNFWKQKRLYIWFLAAISPLILWRWWISHFPEGIPANLWLLNQGNIRFKGAFFYWIFAKRIGELILGYWGLPILILGIILKPKNEGLFFHLWLSVIFLFIVIFAAGNVTHDYYQIPLIPIFSVFLAKGADFLLFKIKKDFNYLFCVVSFVCCFLLMIAFSWYQVRGFYNIQSGVDLAGKWIDENTPKDSIIITGDSNDATLLYNCNRWGWSIGFASPYPNQPQIIEDLRDKKASYYVTTKFDKDSDFGKYMLKNYQILKQTDQYVIFSLKRSNF